MKSRVKTYEVNRDKAVELIVNNSRLTWEVVNRYTNSQLRTILAAENFNNRRIHYKANF